MEATGDFSGIQEINSWLNRVSELEAGTPEASFFYPLTIDELPLKKLNTADENDEDKYSSFDRKLRWIIDDFLKNRPILSKKNDIPNDIKLKQTQVERALDIILSDIRFRDLRLVNQARRLLVLNPWYRDKRPRSVKAEIDCALRNTDLSIHIWQSPEHDTKGECKKVYGEVTGGTIPSEAKTKIYNELDEAIEKVLSE
ncbi:MAG: hypothetical protein ABIE07_09515 [Candidatus Zixiibacteriota bacterium]